MLPSSSTTFLPLASVSVLIVLQMTLKRIHREISDLKIEDMSGMTQREKTYEDDV
ncbi:hypothetical protein JB92DRAFT_2871990, partial [Gautieria morchelliformis]